MSTQVRAFVERWRTSGASERANAQLFLAELCDVLGVERPQPAGAVAEENTYAFERTVKLDDGEGKTTTNFIDLYKAGAFVLEAKQGSDAPDGQSALGLPEVRRFHSLRPTFASWFVQRGGASYKIKEILGHSSAFADGEVRPLSSGLVTC